MPSAEEARSAIIDLNGKELNCLYDISRFGASTDFSLDAILQAVIDFIPPEFQHPEITCARIIFDRYEFTTKNLNDTRWKLAHEITIFIG